ncbi:MAG TPA: hypothetical protein VHU83_15320 [Bryobacteraceae bacterium]|nr:hypothetical protein [Bryobacteraceae bacterium]
MQAAAAQTWESTYTVNTRWAIRLFPSLTDFAFILPAFLLFTFLSGTKLLLTDGDTGWHIRTGEWILQHGAVPMTDLFSFTKPHEAWFAWEWGWDVLFAAIHHFWGLAGVAFVNACLLCGISALLFRLIQRCCGNDVLSLLFTLIAVCGSTIHWLARPHLLSWIFVLVFLHVFVSAERGSVKPLRWLPVLTIAWTNLHGGFFLAVVMVLTAAAGAACSGFAAQHSWFAVYAKAKPYLLCAAGCTAATFVNPYTWRLHQHVFSYLHDAKLLDHISEFQSVNFHHGAAVFFECMLLMGIGSAWWCFRRGKFTPALLLVLFGHLALLYARNIPLFLLIASPWAACMVRSALGRVNWAPCFAKAAAAVADICHDLRAFERVGRSHVTSLLAILLIAALFASGRPGFEAQFDPKQFPIEAIPSLNSVSKSRIFTYDQWSDYMIYRFFPDTKVFMDGRSDFYGSDFVDTYLQIVNAGYNWESDLKRFAVDTVVLRPDAPLATVLKQSRKWKLLFDNGTAIVFAAYPQEPIGRPASTGQARLSPVSHDGGNESEVLTKPRRGSNSEFKNYERRSL